MTPLPVLVYFHGGAWVTGTLPAAILPTCVSGNVFHMCSASCILHCTLLLQHSIMLSPRIHTARIRVSDVSACDCGFCDCADYAVILLALAHMQSVYAPHAHAKFSNCALVHTQHSLQSKTATMAYKQTYCRCCMITSNPSLWNHGVGDLDVFDPLCRALAHHSGLHIVSVGYKLSPEHKFPEGLEDAYSATVWVSQHAADFGADPDRIAVGGDSAGGNFAAVVSVLARDRGGPKITRQVLLYPVVLADPADTGNGTSFKDYATGYYLTTARMAWYLKQYLTAPEDCSNTLVSVSLAQNLANLPAAIVITAEFDILRDQGKDYVDKLQAAGISSQYTCYPGQLHSFIGFATSQYGTDVGLQAIADVAKQLRTGLGLDQHGC